ncbi:substrate-binding domain-containing protein [Streptomyces sp. ISL-112]|uniref:substrate-binding domain-containing protein n=1 Tax=unclassified Streptomyces TaxID=2593676 RepID=UPI001BEC32BE|nr:MULTISPECIES: substrate-binding domain-containing protein [unclassified Streptomyces]MBT2426831.1 substrate-binding domain-containing protein [Streptomyces sp. ISL-112]MBT2461866.1 substrate-binding domain-containing protein [Streptomyces sp. ISL-63]
MEWFSAENVVAVLTAVLGVLASIGVLWYERRVPRHKRIGYRVQMDTPIGSDVSQGRANVRLGLFSETPDMSDATLVLLRVENDGSQSIVDSDYTGRELHGLTAEFTGRTVRGIAVTQPPGAAHLMEHFTPASGMRHSGSLIRLPRVPLNRGEHFKLLVLLTGADVGSPIRITGGIRDGEVTVNRAARPDDKPPLFGRAARLITVTSAKAGGAKAGSPALVALSDGPKPPGHPELRETRVAVSLFSLVVNDRVPVRDLSLADIRRIYAGEIRNWRELGGPDLEILLVSRDANSGTREVFQRRVLDRNEPAQSSRDCATKDDPQAPVIRCELDRTDQVLATVARLDGALGYSELRSGSEPRGLHRIAIDGAHPAVDTIGTSPYPYREIEYAYTYGRPPADSLASSFLGYLSRGRGQDVIHIHGHLPCATPKGLRVCGED